LLKVTGGWRLELLFEFNAGFLMTLAHFAVSVLMKAVNSAGVLPTATAPEASKVLPISGDLTMAATSRPSLSMMARGTPAGAIMP
jgi:hypothetical protein